MEGLIKKSFKERLKDTGFLIKNSFTIVGKDEDIKKPTIHMIVLSIIVSTLFWGSIATFFLGKFVFLGILALLFTIFILVPFRFFYNIRQKADQSWIVYNTISGKDISYADAHNHTKSEKGKLRFIAFVDILMKYAGRSRSNKRGISALLINIFLASLIEVWDLLSHYMLPAVVIEQKPLKEIVPEIKALRTNVPATLVGVFGIDFVGNVVGTLLFPIYLVLLAISVGIGYLIAMSTEATTITINVFSFSLVVSWVPVLIMIYIISIFGGIIKKIVESIKVIYFTIFYTAITRPMVITKAMREELTNYLNMNKSDFAPKSKVRTPQQKYINQLADYVKQYKNAGQSEAQIKQYLLSKGYAAKDVNAAINLARKK